MSHIYNSHPASQASRFLSTHLNNRVHTMEDLAERIARSLGYPQINIETHQDQVLDNIAIACEMFSKFAGYTEEYLVFDSSLYERGRGLPIDRLFCGTPEMQAKTCDTTTATLCAENNTHMATLCADTTGVSGCSGTNIDHCGSDDVQPTSPDMGKKMGYDYDLMSYRKVVDVFSFEEGSNAGINTLFTIEQTLAQQTYFSYALGKYGFDLVSWYTLKNWLDVRKKLLSQDHYFKFDDRRQRLFLTPEPTTQSTKGKFYGLVGAYVEKPIIDLIVEPWVYQYSLALTKITISRVRGKYGSTALFGGGQVNYTDLLSEGNQEKAQLETKLYEGTPGLGDASPPMFFVG